MGSVVPALSQVFALENAAQASRLVQLNRHIGKLGVLCLAPREGLGVEDERLRARVGEERLNLFRTFAQDSNGHGDFAAAQPAARLERGGA
jgi:crotonyl-CoA reductase